MDLISLIQTLGRGFYNLEFVDDECGKIFLGDLTELEIIYYSFLEKESENNIFSMDEKCEVDEILSDLKRMLQEKECGIEEHFCPSCGFDLSDSNVWYVLLDTRVFCPCCGLKFGRVPPPIPEVREIRDRWLMHPEFWHVQKAKPEEWNIEGQMENIPKEYV
jgi:hypothetical protein